MSVRLFFCFYAVYVVFDQKKDENPNKNVRKQEVNHAISFQKKNETKSFSDDLVQCNEKSFEHTV